MEGVVGGMLEFEEEGGERDTVETGGDGLLKGGVNSEELRISSELEGGHVLLL